MQPTTVFIQPALSGFPILVFYILAVYMYTYVSVFCSLVPQHHLLTPFSFHFGFQKKKRKKEWLVGPETGKYFYMPTVLSQKMLVRNFTELCVFSLASYTKCVDVNEGNVCCNYVAAMSILTSNYSKGYFIVYPARHISLNDLNSFLLCTVSISDW